MLGNACCCAASMIHLEWDLAKKTHLNTKLLGVELNRPLWWLASQNPLLYERYSIRLLASSSGSYRSLGS